MKKNLFRKVLFMTAFAFLASTSVMAEEYSYLTFETKDGAKASVEITALTITIKGATLIVGDQTFVLDNLSKMYFSVSDETTSTGIAQLEDIASQNVFAIYDLQGHQVDKNKMTKGVYIVKTKGGTYKIAFK